MKYPGVTFSAREIAMYVGTDTSNIKQIESRALAKIKDKYERVSKQGGIVGDDPGQHQDDSEMGKKGMVAQGKDRETGKI